MHIAVLTRAHAAIIHPKTTASLSGFSLRRYQIRITASIRVITVKPRETGSQHLLIHIHAPHIDFRHISPVAVHILHLHAYALSARKFYQQMACLPRKVLPFLRSVNTI